MRLALLYRLAVPLLLTLASAIAFSRALMLLVLATVFAGLLLFVYRMIGNTAGKTGKTTRESKKFIESSYKIVDDNEEPSEQ